MDIIKHLQSIDLNGFIAAHPRLTDIQKNYCSGAFPVGDPILIIHAESAYNQYAFAYVCQVAGLTGERSGYVYSHLVSSQVLAAASVEEGGMPDRDFLDPHASLRLWMVRAADRWKPESKPDTAFAEEYGRRMGDSYLWRLEEPVVCDRYAAMLGAHFASEYLAAQQEFPQLVSLFQEHYPEFIEYMRSQREPHFGYDAASWIEGHPAVEIRHAGFAARAAEAAAWGLEDQVGFWDSFETGYEEFCKNDRQYFQALSQALSQAGQR